MTTGEFDGPIDGNRHTVEAAVSGPLSDRVAGRLALRYNDQDSYVENRYPEAAFLPPPGPGAGADLGAEETTAARLSLAFRVSDTLQIDLSANHAESDVTTGPFESKPTIGVVENGELVNVVDMPADETRLTIAGNEDGGADAIDGDQFLPGAGIGLAQRLVPGGDFFGYRPSGEDFSFSGDFAFEDHGSTESSGLNAKVTWNVSDSITFTSITDWKRYEKLLIH